MIAASCVEGSETMYSHVPVTGSKLVWIVGTTYISEAILSLSWMGMLNFWVDVRGNAG